MTRPSRKSPKQGKQVRIRLTKAAVRQLSQISNPDGSRIENKLREYKEKPELLETSLTIEQAGVFKDFFKQYGKKLGHFRVGGWRVIGLLEMDVFCVVGFAKRGELEKELVRTIRRFPG